MDTSEENKNAQPSLNAYFQNSSDPDIFDQISKHQFSSDQDGEKKSSDSIDNVSPRAEKDDPTQKPVICRIFSSEDSTVDPEKKPSDGTFFDMLGCNVKYPAATSPMSDGLKINKTYNSVISPELPSDGIVNSTEL